MFNWFKKKIELKKDTDIMSSISNPNGLKLGSEIIVPDNFECLIFHKSKCYHTLTPGKYKIEQKIFPDLIISQQKSNSKLKYVKCVCHYINKSNQNLEIKFKKQKFEISFAINNSINFVELMLLYTYKVDNDYVLSTLKDIFHELLIYVKGDYKKINSATLNDYGITINNFSPIDKKETIFKSNSKNIDNIKNGIDTTTSNNMQEKNNKQLKQNLDIKQSNKEDQANKNSNPTLYTCPKCKNVAKFNTTYCLRCGYKIQ